MARTCNGIFFYRKITLAFLERKRFFRYNSRKFKNPICTLSCKRSCLDNVHEIYNKVALLLFLCFFHILAHQFQAGSRQPSYPQTRKRRQRWLQQQAWLVLIMWHAKPCMLADIDKKVWQLQKKKCCKTCVLSCYLTIVKDKEISIFYSVLWVLCCLGFKCPFV